MIKRPNHKDVKKHIIKCLALGVVFIAFFAGRQVSANILPPGSISTCGELAAPGTYSLTANVSTTTGATCFKISSNSVILTSSTTGSYSVTGNITGDGINPGDPGFNFTIQKLAVVGTTTSNGAAFGSGTTTIATTTAGNAGTITVSTSTLSAIAVNGGANSNLGTTSYSGSGGAVLMASSTVLSISANGGNGNGYGGSGGTISMTGTAVNIVSPSISAAGGMGSTTNGGNGANGSLAVNYASLVYFGAQLSALSDLALNGPGGLPGDLGPFGGGTLATLPGATITVASQCDLPLGGTYYLGANLSGNCRIRMNGVVLLSSTTGSYTINGNVIGDGSNAGNSGNNFTLQNMTVTGTTSSNGVYNGAGASGAGGSITISSSTVATTTSIGGTVLTGNGGSSGTITITNSTSTFVQADGGGSGDGNYDVPGSGGAGGTVLLSSSTVALVQANGGAITTSLGIGGNGGGVYATSSVVTVILTNGGDGAGSLGGGSGFYSGGFGGSIVMVYSTTTSLTVNGGKGDFQGGNGGLISLTRDTLDISSIALSLSGGGASFSGFGFHSAPGALVLNYSTLIRTGVSLPKLSDLVLNGPGGLPGNTGAFIGGALGTIPGDILTNISQCPLTIGGPYYLGADLVGDCQIKANNVTLNGEGHTIHGSVIGDGLTSGITGIGSNGGDPGYNLTLQNITVTGTTTANGHDGLTSGGAGGSITISSSTVATTTANGGAAGPNTFSYKGGNGGTITIVESTTTSIQVNGGLGYYSTAPNVKAVGGNGGTVSIATSTTGAVVANGGDSPIGTGGIGGIVNIISSTAAPAASPISANGGSGTASSTICVFGGNGGTVNLVNSTYGTVTANPGVIANQSSCGGSSSSYSSFYGYQSGSSGQVQVVGEYVPPASPGAPGEEGAPSSPSPSIPSPADAGAPVGSGVSGGIGSSGSALGTVPIQVQGAGSSIALSGLSSFAPSIGSAVAGTAAEVARKTVQAATAVANSPAARTVQATGFLAGLLASVISVADTAYAAPLATEALLTPLRLWGLTLMGLGIRKRGRPWGTVYDSVTKRPIDPAYVTVKNMEGKVVAESITDIDGRYGFLLPDGTYYISVKKSNYEFPSKKMEGKLFDELYNNLYFGEPVTVTAGQVIDKNIPMDQEGFDWNEEAKKELNAFSFHSKNEKRWSLASNYIYGFGFLVSAVTVAIHRSPYNITMMFLYAGVIAFLYFLSKRKKLGHVADSATRTPLSYAIVRVTSVDHETVLHSAVCDARGRYYCIVPKGQYYVDIDKKNPDGSYSKAYISGLISSNSGVLNQDFAL